MGRPRSPSGGWSSGGPTAGRRPAPRGRCAAAEGDGRVGSVAAPLASRGRARAPGARRPHRLVRAGAPLVVRALDVGRAHPPARADVGRRLARPLLSGRAGAAEPPRGVAGARRLRRCWCGSRASAGPTPSFRHRERRPCGSMLSTPEVLRRTGGKPVKSIVYDEATIAARVEELGAEITEAYPDGELLVLGLLKGSFIFLSDLVRHDRAADPGRLPRRQLLRRRQGLERDGPPGLRSRDPARGQTYPAGRGYY